MNNMTIDEISRLFETDIKNLTGTTIKESFGGLWSCGMIRNYPISAICAAISTKYTEQNYEIIDDYIEEIMLDIENKTLDALGTESANKLLNEFEQIVIKIR